MSDNFVVKSVILCDILCCFCMNLMYVHNVQVNKMYALELHTCMKAVECIL